MNNQNIKIIYHKNCMDGIASAFIANHSLTKAPIQEGESYTTVTTIPVQYGEEQILFGRDVKSKLHEPLTKDDIVYFVDFSLKRDLMIELASNVKKIIVIDHHKTAEENLKDLEDELDNINIIFDMNKSGATLCFDYFKSDLKRDLFDYIEDRDLWRWNLRYSKEISTYLRFCIKPNDLESFKEAYENFEDVTYFELGSLLLAQQDKQVASKIKRTKDITIQGITFKSLNATENISEIGNAICTTYDTPALIYFFTEKDEVVCSLRSIDTLEDVSVVAKAFGGGGHRNACGFTLSIRDFCTLQEVQSYESLESIASFLIDRGFIEKDNSGELESYCINRDWNVSISWQKMTNWSVEVYTGYKESYKSFFYSDGHISKDIAVNNALNHFQIENK